MAINRVFLGPEYYPSPTIGRPIAGGQIFVGEPDLDPEIVGNQKQVQVLQEDGNFVNVTQPILTGNGGVPLHNGDAVTLYVEGDYSIKVNNSSDVQVYYVPNTNAIYVALEDLADTGADKGANLVGYEFEDGVPTGTAARTVQNKLDEVISVKDWGAVGDGTADDTAAFQSVWTYINASTAGGVRILIPSGNYLITASPGVLTHHRVHIVGDGIKATTITFNPSLAATLFDFDRFTGLAGTIVQCSLSDLSCYSTNAVKKVAVEITDATQFSLHEIDINGSAGWTSAADDSVGIITRGRERVYIKELSCNADNCIQVKANPATADISADHFHWQDLNLISAAATNPLISVDNDCSVFNWTIDGTNVFALGSYGVYWGGAGTAAQTALNISFRNIRREQEEDATAHIIFIEPSSGMADLTLDNIYGGLTSEGFRLQASRVSLDHVSYIGTGEALDITDCSRTVDVEECFWQAGSTFTQGTLALMRGVDDPTTAGPLPMNAQYLADADNAGTQSFIRERDARKTTLNLTIASGARVNIPSSDNQGRTMAQVFLSGYSATGPVNEAAVIADFPGLNAAVKLSGTALCGVGNTAGSLTYFNEGSVASIFNQHSSNETLEVLVDIVWTT